MINPRKLISNATFSVIQTIVSAFVLFFLYRYILQKIGSEQLGLWSVILASTSVVRLSEMGLAGSVVKYVSRYRAINEPLAAAAVVETATISIAVIMGILCLVAYPFLSKFLVLIIPSSSMNQALNILPWAVLSLWIGAVSGVFQSGLDGCQCIKIRNALMVFCNLFLLLMAVLLVPRYGIVGLAYAQIIQGFSLLVLSWCFLRNKLIFLPLLPFFWSKSIFKEIFSYAFNFQINAIAIILFDPVVKMFMSRYGGLSNTAYFEMASQLVTKLRSLITAAIQVLVPTIAEVHETAPEKIREIYLKSYSLTFLISVPFYIALIIALPIIGMAWLGPVASNFLIFSSIIAFGWGLNTLSVPAYFVNLGTGDLKSNTIAHVVMIFFIFPLGFLLGYLFGPTGIALSSMLSILISSFIVLYAASKKYKVSLHSLFPREHLNLLFASMFFLAFSILLNLSNLQSATIYIFEVINLISYIGSVFVIFWFHPSKNSIIKLLRARQSNSI